MSRPLSPRMLPEPDTPNFSEVKDDPNVKDFMQERYRSLGFVEGDKPASRL